MVLKDKVNILIIFCAEDPLKSNDILMRQTLQHHDLAIGPLRISAVLKGVEYFFKSVDLAGLFIKHFPDMPIGAVADLFL